MKKIVLDEKKCLAQTLSLQETLLLAAASMSGFKAAVDNLVSRGVLCKDSFNVSPQWTGIVSKLVGSEDERLSQLALQMKECFPKGKMPGTPFYYRCNTRELVLKLKKFFEKYGDYSDEDILKATRQFVASFRGDYRFLPLAKYFIMKNKTVMDEEGENHIVEASDLASALENMTDEEDIPEISSSDEWLVNSRN